MIYSSQQGTTFQNPLNRAELRHDQIHNVPTFGGRTIESRIRIIEDRWNTVVVATDLSDSIYSSITLYTEELAEVICEDFQVDRDRLVWIEHIPARPELGRLDHLYDLVHFDQGGAPFSRPYWTPLSEEEVDILTGCLLLADL